MSVTPIPMILFCPTCGAQHIDAAETDEEYAYRYSRAFGDKNLPRWTNPPHKSHLCHFCKTVWRPCDVETTGVKHIKTKGQHDTIIYTQSRVGK